MAKRGESLGMIVLADSGLVIVSLLPRHRAAEAASGGYVRPRN
jgi:hypothetical protein